MKTITKAEYEALPVEKHPYWIEKTSWVSMQFGCEPVTMISYTRVTISLEDAEGVIESLKKTDLPKYPPNYSYGWNAALTEAFNKMKGV